MHFHKLGNSTVLIEDIQNVQLKEEIPESRYKYSIKVRFKDGNTIYEYYDDKAAAEKDFKGISDRIGAK